jgi:tetratricopeptide (TPR) repeat protein
MKKLSIFFLCLALLAVFTAGLAVFFSGTGLLAADETEDGIVMLKSIIRTSIEDNSYERIIEALGSFSDIDALAWKNEDIAYFKTELLRAAVKAESTADPVVTGRLLDEAVRVLPNDFRLSVKLLKSYLELGQTVEGSALYAELREKFADRQDDPEFAAAGHAEKGVGLMISKQYDLAKAEFQLAIEKDPKWTGGYFLMAALTVRMRDYAAAEADLKKILELNPYHQGAKQVLNEILPKKMAEGRDEALGETKE